MDFFTKLSLTKEGKMQLGLLWIDDENCSFCSSEYETREASENIRSRSYSTTWSSNG